MRIQKIQPKSSAEITIPEDLLGFFKEVHDLIRKNDDIVTTESDDLIQSEFAYGGLIEEKTDRFGFIYFPEQGTSPCWSIELTASDIGVISSSKKKTLTLWKCQSLNCRSLFSSAQDACFDCDYVDDELVQKNRILSTLSQSSGRQDWVKGYLANLPEAGPLEIIGDYNSQPELGAKWGYFSLSEMQELIEKQKR
jgi:hypothetical protein